jgi:hypothetical protein
MGLLHRQIRRSEPDSAEVVWSAAIAVPVGSPRHPTRWGSDYRCGDPMGEALLPEAYDVEGVLTGPLVVVGFAVSLALSAI